MICFQEFKFLVACISGNILEVTIPNAAPNSNKSYRLSIVAIKQHLDLCFIENYFKACGTKKSISISSVGNESSGEIIVWIYHLLSANSYYQFSGCDGAEIFWMHYINLMSLWISAKSVTYNTGGLFEYDYEKNEMRKIVLNQSENIPLHSFLHM